MIDLSRIFSIHAPNWTAAENGAAQTGAGTDSSEKSSNHLTLEYKDTPFISFMRRLKEMIMTDPKEAMRMIQNAKLAKIFTKPHEEGKIKEKLTEVVEALHREQPHSPTASFLRSTLDIGRPITETPRHPETPGMHLRPAFAPPALTGLTPLMMPT